MIITTASEYGHPVRGTPVLTLTFEYDVGTSLYQVPSDRRVQRRRRSVVLRGFPVIQLERFKIEFEIYQRMCS